MNSTLISLDDPKIFASLTKKAKILGYEKRLFAAMESAPLEHPLAPPTLSGNRITVDLMLNQPTRITRMIMDLTLQRFIADQIFANGGGVTGGAVIYEVADVNQLYLDRDIQRVAPGEEFPVVTSQRHIPAVATPEKWGGKTWVTDEARDRNMATMFTNRMRQLGNTVVRKINQRAIETLDAAVSAYSQTFAGNNWSTIVTAGTSASNASSYPARDFAKAQMLADQQELGITYDLWIINPQEYLNLVTVYGAFLADVLNSLGIRIYVTNRVTAGTSYVVASGQVGEMRIEKALGTETWREPETERTWVQASVRPLWFVDNPYAVIKVTGLAG